MLLLGLYACHKEEATIPGGNGTTEINVTPRVKAFVERASHHAVEAGRAVLSADSAVWYLEAGVNYSIAQAWVQRTELATDTLILPFDFSSGTVSATTLFEAFAQLSQEMAPLNGADQNLLMVDVVENHEQLSSGQLKAIYYVASGNERGYNNPPNTYYSPNFVAHYSYPSPAYCNSTTSHGADEIIQDRINGANTIGLQPGQYLYDMETWRVDFQNTYIPSKKINWKDPFLASSTPHNNGYHETLFFSWDLSSSVGSPCLNAAEMSYWTGNATTHGTWRGITKIRQQYCATKIFLKCDLVAGAFYPNSPGSNQYAVHLGDITYGRIGNPAL